MKLKYCYTEGLPDIFEISPGTYFEYIKIRKGPDGFAIRVSMDKAWKAKNRYLIAKSNPDFNLFKLIAESR